MKGYAYILAPRRRTLSTFIPVTSTVGVDGSQRHRNVPE